MGCHTWFNNRLDNISEKDLNKLKENTLERIKEQRILKSDSHKDWVETVTKWHIDPDTKREFISEDFWKKRRKHVLWAKSVLESDDPNLNSVLNVLKEFGGLVYDDAYDLAKMGWHDKFRVYGYPDGIFNNAKEAIKFLKEYNQDYIEYKKKKGYCDEIGEIITNFFNEYPNGYIEYG